MFFIYPLFRPSNKDAPVLETWTPAASKFQIDLHTNPKIQVHVRAAFWSVFLYMCLLRARLELTLVFVWSQSLKRPEVSAVFHLEHFEMKQFRWLTTLEGPWYTCENFPLGILWSSSCSKVKSSEFKGLAVKKSGQPFPGSKSFSKETSLRVQIS